MSGNRYFLRFLSRRQSHFTLIAHVASIEYVLNVDHYAKKAKDLDKLRMLDEEAERLVKELKVGYGYKPLRTD